MEVLILAVLLGVAGGLAYVVLRNAQDFSDANEIIPGVPTRAPKAWAGAHSPEARLHRRIRDSMTALRNNASLDDPSLDDVRRALEREALAVDDRLVAVASLPGTSGVGALRDVERAVDAIEQAVASVVVLRGPSLEDVDSGIRAVRTRLELVEAARAELESLSSSATPDLEALRRELEATSGPDEPRSDTDQPPAG